MGNRFGLQRDLGRHRERWNWLGCVQGAQKKSDRGTAEDDGLKCTSMHAKGSLPSSPKSPRLPRNLTSLELRAVIRSSEVPRRKKVPSRNFLTQPAQIALLSSLPQSTYLIYFFLFHKNWVKFILCHIILINENVCVMRRSEKTVIFGTRYLCVVTWGGDYLKISPFGLLKDLGSHSARQWELS